MSWNAQPASPDAHEAKNASTNPVEIANRSDTGSSSPTAEPADSSASPGVVRIAAIGRQLTVWDRVALFIGVFLIAYAYGLDGQIRNTYQARPPLRLPLRRLHRPRIRSC